MAREIGMNPAKLGKFDNHRQEPWKAPLPEFIESLYRKSLGKDRPGVVLSIEERAREIEKKKATKREAKYLRREAKKAALTAPSSLQPSAPTFPPDPPEEEEPSGAERDS